MAIIRCDKGHYYDNTKFSQCPHCGVLPVMEKEQQTGKDNGQPEAKAKPKSKRFSFFRRGEDKKQEAPAKPEISVKDEDDSTVAIPGGNSFEDDDRTVAMPVPPSYASSSSEEDDDRTIAMPAPSQESAYDEDDDRTIAMPSASEPLPYDEDDDRTIAIPAASATASYDEDDDRTIAIPSAASATSSYDEDDDRTIAIPAASATSSYDEDDDRTIAIPAAVSAASSFDDDDDRTIAISPAVSAASQTEAPPVSIPAQKAETVKTRPRPEVSGLQQSAAPGQPSGFVVGWLVCTDGPQKGSDYRLCKGFNRLGGSDRMDIAVKGDAKLGDFASCAVVYDDKNNEFFAVKQADENVFLNEENLQGAVKLASGDHIRAGNSEFEFIAFCREGRLWDSYE